MDLPSTGGRPDPLGSDQPWLTRKDWASGDLYYSVVRDPSTFIVSGFGVCLLLIGIGFAVSLPALFRQGGYAACIPLLVTGSLGIALTTRGVRLMIRWIKYGGWRFHLASVPVPLGGPLRGELKMSTPIPTGQPVRLRLECCMVTSTERVKNDGSKDLSTTSSTVWEDEETVTSDGSGAVQVSFVTPADCHATKLRPRSWETRNEWVASSWWIEWRLTVRDPSGGRQGYFAEFELPVFQVAETAQQAREAESIRAARKTEIESYRPGPDFRVRVSPGADGGVEFFFPPVRGGANAIGQTIAFLVTAALFAAVWEGLALWLVAIWGTIEILFLGWIFRLWFAPEQVVISNGMITVTSGLFAKKRQMPTAEVTAIHAAKQGYTLYNHIRIVGHGWHMIAVGDGIRENRDAEWLALQMSAAAGVQPAPSIPSNTNAEMPQMIDAFMTEFLGKTSGRPFASLNDTRLGRPEKPR